MRREGWCKGTQPALALGRLVAQRAAAAPLPLARAPLLPISPPTNPAMASPLAAPRASARLGGAPPPRAAPVRHAARA